MDDSANQFTQPFASTSRAVFTLPHKPVKKSKEQHEAEDYLARSHKLYQTAWKQTTDRIHTVLSTLHSASLTSVCAFVDSAYQSPEPSLFSALAARTPLPTGLVIGASPGSSSLLFASLTRQLTGSGNNVVARLSSRDCATVKGALRGVVASFVGGVADEEEDEVGGEEDATQVYAAGPKSAALAPEDVQNLAAWYQHRFGKASAVVGKGKANAPGPNLVVLLEDLEAFDGKVLGAMIETLSRYVPQLPLVLLLGVATSADALYNAVTRPVTNLLDVVPFFVEPGVDAFCALIKGVFIEWDAPLALGPKAHAYLWKTFSIYDHSIDAAISAIQLLYMNYFTTHDEPPLTLPPPIDVDLLPYDLPDSVLTYPSVQDSLKRFPTGLVAHLSQADSDGDKEEAMLDLVAAARKAKDEWRRKRADGFEGLCVAREFWDKKRPMEEMINKLIDGDLEGWSGEVTTLVLLSASDKLPKFLTTLLDALDSTTPIHKTLAKLSAKLDALLAQPKPAGRQNLINMNQPGAEITQGKRVHDLDRQYSLLARQVSEALKKTWDEAFRPSSGLLLHELWFSNDVKPLKAFHPSAQAAFYKTLTEADATATAATSTAPAVVAPDVAVAFRLYRDSGRLINLADWWSAFEQAAVDEDEGAEAVATKGGGEKRKPGGSDDGMEVDGDEANEEEDDEDDNPRRRKQARFLRAVADLSHAGYVQPTSRKVEHVGKTIF